MSCQRCIYRVVLSPLRVHARPLSTSASLRITPSTGAQADAAPATAEGSSPAAADEAPKSATPHVVSAAPAGTVLRGLNYLKNKQDPVALEDHEYPAWLWTVLDEKKGDALGEDVGDAYSKSKKERRTAAKRAAKLALKLGAQEERIPIDEQTLDIPFAVSNPPVPHVVSAVGGLSSEPTVVIGPGGLSEITFEQAAAARNEIKREKRAKNRAAIKERNFLGGL